MDTKTIIEIIGLMKESDLSEFEIEEQGLKLRIRRGNSGTLNVSSSTLPHMIPTPTQASPHALPQPAPGPEEPSHGTFIKSPMVGTFYQASTPSNPPYVKVGDKIQSSSIVCIIEAMKVMNEIHAEIQGTVLEVLVKNGQTVEYGQPLFRLKQD